MFTHPTRDKPFHSRKKAISPDWSSTLCPHILAGYNFVVILCAVIISLKWQCWALGKVPKLVLTFRLFLPLSFTLIRLDPGGSVFLWHNNKNGDSVLESRGNRVFMWKWNLNKYVFDHIFWSDTFASYSIFEAVLEQNNSVLWDLGLCWRGFQQTFVAEILTCTTLVPPHPPPGTRLATSLTN